MEGYFLIQDQNGVKVLILIVMEDTLGEISTVERSPRQVLILIVMEDTLGG